MKCTDRLLTAIAVSALFAAFASAVPTTTRISVAADGTEGNNYSGYYGIALSDNGQYAAFGSDASNLVPGDTNGKTDIFRRNNQTGEIALISVGYDGSPANDRTTNPCISADGRWVAFASRATNLVENDTNGKSDVFVRDMLYGVTTRISVSPTGIQGDRDSTSQSISADGRWVAFLSGATNLVPGDVNGMADIFLRDMYTDTTTLISLSSTGIQTNSTSNAPAISADGRYVAFASLASNLSEADKNTHWDIFLRDTHTGTTTMVSVRSDGTQGAVSNSYSPSVDRLGRYVVFESYVPDLVPNDTNSDRDIFAHDSLSGFTTAVSVGMDTAVGNKQSNAAGIDSAGRYVVFFSDSTNLVPDDTNGQGDIFVRDLQNSVTSLVSVAWNGSQGNSASYSPAISRDGLYVAYASDATNLVQNDTNGMTDIFLYGPLFEASVPFDMADAEKALRIAGGLYNPTEAAYVRCNVDPDTGVTFADAVNIARKVAGVDPNP